MTKISNKHIKAWEKFNTELNAFREETGDDFAILYEDAFTTREVKDFKLLEDNTLIWEERDGNCPRTRNFEVFEDLENDSKDWLSFWKGCLRRAKRYWSMDAVELDRLQDCETNDEEDE